MKPILRVRCLDGKTRDFTLFVSMSGVPILPAKGDFVLTRTPMETIIPSWVEKIVWRYDLPEEERYVFVHALEYDPNTGITADGWTVSL